MDLKRYLIFGFKVTIASTACLLIFHALINFAIFMSDPYIEDGKQYKNGDWISFSWSLFINMGLLTIFVLQHSVMASTSFKDWCMSYNIHSLQRSLYVLSTALSLQLLMNYWLVTPAFIVWEFDMKTAYIWWSYCTIHIVSWILIYVGAIIMDVNELLGIKQVYYSIKNLPDPNSQKSQQLQRLYSHMRHPGFIAFLLIFWVTPVMRLDRLLLAIILTLYMYVGWTTDLHDYRYQQLQYVRKFHELNRLK